MNDFRSEFVDLVERLEAKRMHQPSDSEGARLALTGVPVVAPVNAPPLSNEIVPLVGGGGWVVIGYLPSGLIEMWRYERLAVTDPIPEGAIVVSGRLALTTGEVTTALAELRAQEQE